MQVKVRSQGNVSRDDLVKMLSGYIAEEGLRDDVLRRLQKSESDDHHEPIPEKYIRTIVRNMNRQYGLLMRVLSKNVHAWFTYRAKPRRKFLRKAKDRPFLPTNEQIEDLKELIAAHFKIAIGIDVSENVRKRWKQMGVELPIQDFSTFITQSYAAGRISNLVENTTSFSDMLKQAKKAPFTRVDELMLQAAQTNAVKYIKGFGERLGDLAEDMLTIHHKSALHDVVQSYFSGDLTHTTYNEEGFSPQEAEELLSTDKAVKGWRELSTELRNRFKAVDVNRDWDRVAISEVRYATNLGRLVNIQDEGGGNPDEIDVYYHVQPTACKYCKKLFLNEDGSPKIFKLSEILGNVQDTGGMQIGLKASLIGEKGGWVPNATCHANGHCFPLRVIPGYPMISPNGGDDS